MSRFFVVTRVCPACKVQSQLLFAAFEALVRFSGYVLCDACNKVSGGTPMSQPRMYDTEDPLPGGLHEHLFGMELQCEDEKCRSPIFVLAPKMRHYKTAGDLLEESTVWQFGPEVKCDRGHAVMKPVHPLDTEVYHPV